jgi:uncharacterized protein YjdB
MKRNQVGRKVLNGRAILACVIAFIMFCGVFSWDIPKALAADGTISMNGTYDISAYGNNSTIIINSGLSITLTNTSNTTCIDTKIICGEGVELTINGIKVSNTSNNAAAISFTGNNNQLILVGMNELQGDDDMPGIKVEAGISLEISGDGYLWVNGKGGGAGIGASNGQTCGNISISAKQVDANSDGGGAGIGGGAGGDGGIIQITGGYVSADGGTYGAGIGGGQNGAGGAITISGGTAMGNGGDEGGAGIGGGYGGDGGTILITDDNVPEKYAASGYINVCGTGRKGGAGIGGGYGGSAGLITISGGYICAEKGENAPYDVGSGLNGTGGSLNLSDSGVLFLEHGACITPTTSTHTLKTPPIIQDFDAGGDKAYGFYLPAGWGTSTYVYLDESKLYDLTYNASGGTGTVPETLTQYKGTTTAITDGNTLAKGGVAFTKWNTARDGRGSDYTAGVSLTMTKDLKLYAVYGGQVNVTGVTLSTDAAAMDIGDTLVLTAKVLPADTSYPEVMWNSNNEPVAVVSQSGVVTAKGAGTATIIATADGVSAECTISVRAKFNITAAANNAAYGNVSGGGAYVTGTSVTLNATPNPGYRFVRWTENGNAVTESPSYSLSATRDATFTAEFTPLTPVGIRCSKTDATLYDSSNGSVTISVWGGDSGAYQYSLDGGLSWQGSNMFSGLSARTYTAAVRDAGYTANSATVAVTVGQPAHTGVVPAKRLSSKPNAGTAVTLVPPVAPKGYTTISVTYSSSNPSVAAVDSNGNITFLAGGKATITTKVISQMVDRKGRIKTKTTMIKKTVTVKQPVASISLNMTDVTIARTQKVKLIVNVAPATASKKKVKWTSSNPRVASVSSSGVVTGKAGGTAVITCRALDGSNVAENCNVVVTPIYPNGLKISKAAVSLKQGKTTTLKASVLPKKADFKTVTWSSSDTTIATVDAKGKVRGIIPGVVTITAATSNGYAAYCTVTIK